MAAPTSSVWRMADTLAGGKLAERIAELRADDASPDRIARQLYADHGIEVTRQTIYSWLAILDTDPVDAA